MKTILTGILSLIIFFGVVPTYIASEMNLQTWKRSRRRKRRKERRLERKVRRVKRFLFKGIWF